MDKLHNIDNSVSPLFSHFIDSDWLDISWYTLLQYPTPSYMEQHQNDAENKFLKLPLRNL